MVWAEASFADLLVDSRDGEWGEGSETLGHQLCEVVRGTDFADLNSPGIELPQRWIPDHLVERKKLQPGDIIFEMAGGTAKQSTGRSALLPQAFFDAHGEKPVLCASFCRHLRLDQNKYDPAFIYYLLQVLYEAGYMAVFNIQHTGVSRFQYTSFKKQTVLNVPDLLLQRKIGGMLSAYDALIENNRRRIGLLEKMAEEIYREWFVRLRFPGHEAAKFSKGLPEGWFFEEIGFVTDFVSRGIAPNYDETASSTVINQKCVRDGRIDLAPARNLKNEIPTAKCLQVGDVLINSTGTGTLGRVAQVLEPLKNTTVDTHLTIVRPSKKVTQHFFGMQLMQMEKHFTALGDGATNQTELKRELIRSSKIILPAEPVMLEFDRICAPIRQQCCQLQSQIKCLKQTRDVFLPRLISGKLSVEALDIQFPPGIQAV